MSPIDKVGYMPGGVYNPGSSSSYGGSGYGGSGMSSYGNSGGFGNNYGGGSGLGGYGGRYPQEGGSINGPYPGPGGLQGGMPGGPMQGLFPPDLEGKTSLILPLAGAALLGSLKPTTGNSNQIIKNRFFYSPGIAAYALVASPAMAMGPMIGKRRKRSLFDEKLEQHMAYRAHHKQAKQV